MDEAIQIVEEIAVDLSQVEALEGTVLQDEGAVAKLSMVSVRLMVRRLNKAAALLRGEEHDA